jgi:tetratricopeptide (TPR) repeat protein
MKYALLILLTLLIDPSKIGKVNSLKSKAKESYQRGEYKEAAQQYKTLTDSLGVREEEVSMNLAHSYFHLNDTAQAQNAYLAMTNSTNAHFRSVSYQQLGVLAHRQGKLEEALNYFKSALKADPSNEEARYNYEMVKKKIEEQKKQEQQKKDDQNQDQKDQKDKKDQKDNKDEKKNDQQKKDQEKKDQEQKDKQKQDQKDQEKKDQENKEKQNKDKEDKEKKEDTPPNVSDKLKDMKISEEKAKMVLEAMKNQEVQYLQQNKRKATKPKSKGKPDW